jgi:hypothetical protein
MLCLTLTNMNIVFDHLDILNLLHLCAISFIIMHAGAPCLQERFKSLQERFDLFNQMVKTVTVRTDANTTGMCFCVMTILLWANLYASVQKPCPQIYCICILILFSMVHLTAMAMK